MGLGSRYWGLVAASLFAVNFIVVGETVAFAETAATTSPLQTVADTSSTIAPQELLRLKTADPAADVADAIKKGDLRFLEVAGFSVEIPGISKGPKLGWLVLRYGVRRIEGTTDSNMLPELQQAAQRYAERYNALLLEHIERQ
jgi:hypothetical protein